MHLAEKYIIFSGAMNRRETVSATRVSQWNCDDLHNSVMSLEKSRLCTENFTLHCYCSSTNWRYVLSTRQYRDQRFRWRLVAI